MTDQPIKAAASGFTKDPFYLIQSNGAEKRYVVSLPDKIGIRTLLAGFVNQCEKEIQIKIRDLTNVENFTDYFGQLSPSALHELMTRHEDVIFHNGYHDFMLRNPKTGDVIAFDDHGLIFIYTDQDYSTVLGNLQVAFQPDEKLIHEYDHWHYCLPGGREMLTDMIRDFGLRIE